MIAAPALVALVVSALFQPLAIALLRRHSILDLPNERSSHVLPTPRGGGLVVIASVLVGFLLLPFTTATIGLAITVACAGLLGVLEDLKGVRVSVRLLAQTVCCLPLLLTITSEYTSWWLVWVVGGAFIVGAINCVNFMDGVNGITGGFAIAVGLSLCLVFSTIGQPVLAGAALVLVAACVGFLPYNALQARIFLGDSGSYGIGAAAAGLCLLACVLGASPEAAVAPFAIYIADTSVTLLRRLRAGEPIHQAHRTHIYQRLTDRGWSHGGVAAYVSILTLLCGILGWSGMAISQSRIAADIAIGVLVVGYLGTPKLLARSSWRRGAESRPGGR